MSVIPSVLLAALPSVLLIVPTHLRSVDGHEEAPAEAHALAVVHAVAEESRQGRVHRGAPLLQYIPGNRNIPCI